MISSLLSVLGKCLFFFWFVLSLFILFIRLCGKVWGKVQLKDGKGFFNNLILGHIDAREVAEEQELL